VAKHAQTRPQGGGIQIRRIFTPPDPLSGEGRPKPRRWEREERARQAEPRRLQEREHPGQTDRASVGERSHQHGFGLIRRVVPQQEMQDAGFPARCREGTKSRCTGPLGQGRTSSEAVNRQHLRLHPACGEPGRGKCRLLA
jgi:hypothetical protein